MRNALCQGVRQEVRECDQAESRREKEVSREVVIPGFNSLSGRYQHINAVRLAITSHLTSSQSYPSHPYTSAQTTSAVTKIIGKSGPVLIPTPHSLFSTFHFTFESAPVPRSRDRGRCLGLWGDTPGMAPSATTLGLPCQALSVKSTIRLPSDIGPGEAGGPWRSHPAESVCAACRRMPEGGPMPDEDTARRI